MMRGRTAVVTGSTSGIGKGIAAALAEAGANVMLNGFGDAGEIEAQRVDLETRFAIKAGYHDGDMTKPAEIRALVAEAEARFGQVDILVNNAGIQHTDKIEDFPDDRWDAVIAINLSSSFHTTKAVVGGMKQRGWGRIVNISSVHGLVASVEKVAYIAAKHGLIGMTKVTALETAGTGVTCNAICPGWVNTPLVMTQIQARADQDSISTDQATVDLLSEKQPSGQFTTIEQLGATAVFLCSDAASNMSGTTMTLDGAWSAQ
ncbi:MAG: 3-hydroxybutyrate dehydrogenase [Alphaproteobacteria bacterium]|nr:3-hydroxybutyrate dehydrogenase [Alphaproteobacteria bacterium]